MARAARGPSTAGPPVYTFDDIGIAGGSIPSLLVIPGSVGYLKQFFSAQLAVGNGAPEGSGLVVRDVTDALKKSPAEARLSRGQRPS